MKRKLWGIGGVVAALVLAAGILVLTVDIDTHKTRNEAAASEAMGMKVSILGTVRLELLPQARLSPEDLFTQNRGVALLSAPHLVERIRFLPLLKVGPLGTLLTKAIDFGSILQEIPGAKSEIRVHVSDWDVRSGVAEAHDVTFTTSKNRFALAGRLDFVHNLFEDLSVAVLNAKSCAMSSQRIHGDFTNPQIDLPIPPLSVLGPFLSLLKKPFEMLQGGECKVNCRGSVEQP